MSGGGRLLPLCRRLGRSCGNCSANCQVSLGTTSRPVGVRDGPTCPDGREVWRRGSSGRRRCLRQTFPTYVASWRLGRPNLWSTAWKDCDTLPDHGLAGRVTAGARGRSHPPISGGLEGRCHRTGGKPRNPGSIFSSYELFPCCWIHHTPSTA